MTKPDFLQNSGTLKKGCFFVLSFYTQKTNTGNLAWLQTVPLELPHRLPSNKSTVTCDANKYRHVKTGVFAYCIFASFLRSWSMRRPRNRLRKCEESHVALQCRAVRLLQVIFNTVCVVRTCMDHHGIPPSNTSTLMHKQLFGIHSKQCLSPYY